MSSARTFQRSFSGGEVTSEFWGQLGDAKFQAGLALCRNFKVLPHGPIENRTGTQFVRKAKNGDTGATVRLIPFEYSDTQTLALEFSAGFIRFHTMGATVEASPGVPYEVATPYAQADLLDLHYVQSADVMTIVHQNYPPKELRRLGATNWTLVDIVFGPTMAAPGGTGGTATLAGSPSGLRDYVYVVTAKPENGDETYPSAQVTLNNNLLQTGASNKVTWSTVAGAQRYAVYLQSNGLFGYIGETDGLEFVDDNITPDISTTPPLASAPFSGPGNHPRAVSYFEQRRVFGGTAEKPQNVWMTRTGTESNLNYSIPARDDDSVSFRISARQVNTVRHIVPLTNLVLLTNSTEWRVNSVNSDAITPSSRSVKAQSYVGASNVQPVIVNNNILYAAARGGHVQEMAFDRQAEGYLTGDLCLRAPHLFNGFRITDMAYAKCPTPVTWATSSNGKLLGITYVPEQQVGAWHQHDTGAGDKFVSVCSVAEGEEDAVYVAVQRKIGGNTKTYVERFASRQYADLAHAVFVDSSLTYDGAEASTFSGLSHLEGRTVSILADGAEHPPRVVAAGAVTLDVPAKVVTIGIPIEADAQTLPMAFEIMAFGQGRVKNVNRAWMRVNRSSGISTGPSFDKLVPHKQRTIESLGTPPSLITDEVSIDVPPSWQSGGQLCVRQSSPLPLTIVSLSIEAEVGG